MSWLGWLGVIGVLGGLIYWSVAALALRVWMAEAEAVPIPTPPVSFLRPIKRGSPRLRELLEMHAAALRENDELILGVDDDEAATIVTELARRWPQRRIVVVRGVQNERGNPKMAKLVEMARHAGHADWILCDSELCCDLAFSEALRCEWAASGADVLTCGYRLVDVQSWPQRLDAAAVLWTLWPGLAVVRWFARPRFALGACTAVRRDDLAAAGGFEAWRDELADDYQLGARLSAVGKMVRLARTIATLASDALSWRDWWRHQRRVAVTYRACAPLGYAGQALTFAIAWGLVAVGCLEVEHRLAMLGLIGPVLVALGVAGGNARRIGFSISRLLPMVPLAALVEAVCWTLSWGARRVWWGGRWRRITWRGKLRD
jgi:ceramide glucosyltransferase